MAQQSRSGIRLSSWLFRQLCENLLLIEYECVYFLLLFVFHLSCHGLPACVCMCVCVPAHQPVSSGTWRCVWRATSMYAWLLVCLPVHLCHLWVLVVSWHGWPMSLWVSEELGLKYSSAVSAAGLVTAGLDIWVTRACRQWALNIKDCDVKACYHFKPGVKLLLI